MESRYIKETITLTFGNRAENNVGMQIIGTKFKDGDGLTHEDLLKYKKFFEEHGCTTELYDLKTLVNINVDDAYFLVIKGGCALLTNEYKLTTELLDLEWDSKAKMYGRVCNKKARHNLTFDFNGQEPNYEIGNGRIVSYDDTPYLHVLRNNLSWIVKKELVVEGNLYYDTDICGIGYHGDSERHITIGVRLGISIPICFSWFLNNKPIGEKFTLILDHTDIYFMSEKATGVDWKKRSIPTLRHSAGCSKYTDLPS
jgi:hypothetical protein